MATRYLYVLRHAKSSWDDPFLSDAERPLAQRGRDACAALRRHFASIGLSPQLVLCSPSQRTRETWDRVADGVSGQPQVRYVSTVYGASAQELLELMHQVPEDIERLMLIGHNPGIEDLIASLDRSRSQMPTGAFATVEVSGAWAQLDQGTATLRSLVRPRELAAG